jgi:ankyrin repeat protein
VDVARTLLDAGAEVDALADLYGQGCTTMSLLVSSCHPANAGLHAVLANLLLDYGASIEDDGRGKWSSPLMTALAFGYTRTAEALAARGARTDSLPVAAGLGRLDEARRLLPAADPEARHKALALAAQHGHVEVVTLLLDAGEDPSRYNPEGNHAHSTPLHQAVYAGHEPVVRLLVERGARLDLKDKIYQSTPLGWATHCGRNDIAAYLRGADGDQS